MLKTKLSRLGKESGKTTSAIISYQIWFSCDRFASEIRDFSHATLTNVSES
jgi:hypothetical protein